VSTLLNMSDRSVSMIEMDRVFVEFDGLDRSLEMFLFAWMASWLIFLMSGMSQPLKEGSECKACMIKVIALLVLFNWTFQG